MRFPDAQRIDVAVTNPTTAAGTCRDGGWDGGRQARFPDAQRIDVVVTNPTTASGTCRDDGWDRGAAGTSAHA